jgi:hypothetical protein
MLSLQENPQIFEIIMGNQTLCDYIKIQYAGNPKNPKKEDRGGGNSKCKIYKSEWIW